MELLLDTVSLPMDLFCEGSFSCPSDQQRTLFNNAQTKVLHIIKWFPNKAKRSVGKSRINNALHLYLRNQGFVEYLIILLCTIYHISPLLRMTWARKHSCFMCGDAPIWARWLARGELALCFENDAVCHYRRKKKQYIPYWVRKKTTAPYMHECCYFSLIFNFYIPYPIIII